MDTAPAISFYRPTPVTGIPAIDCPDIQAAVRRVLACKGKSVAYIVGIAGSTASEAQGQGRVELFIHFEKGNISPPYQYVLLAKHTEVVITICILQR
jgi:hypothetical protein